jgi:hypothetical protein
MSTKELSMPILTDEQLEQIKIDVEYGFGDTEYIISRLLAEVTRLREENRMLRIAVDERASRVIGFKNELDVYEAELNEIDKL